MVMNAFKNGVTPLNEATMNTFLALQEFDIIYEGTLRNSKTGSGVLENLVSDYNYAIRFQSTGVTELARLELNIDKDGNGSDLIIEIRDNTFNPDGSNLGVLKKRVVLPAEFFPTVATFVSIPINLTGLTSNAYYWILVYKAGDGTNNLALVGETTTDANFPVYRRALDSGAWTASNAIHFKTYSGISGLPRHEIYGTNGICTIEYSSGIPNKLYLYLPPSDGTAGGIRNVLTISYSGGMPYKGV